MSNNQIVESVYSTSGTPSMEHDTKEKKEAFVSAVSSSDNDGHQSDIASNDGPSNGNDIPWQWKLASVILVSMIGFGSHWSSGITGAMKSTIKKEMKIDNKQYALLSASQDFMVTALMMVSGLVTDRIGGAGKSTISFVYLQLLTISRRDLLWQHHLHNWLYSHCRSCSNQKLSIHDWWYNCSSSWRYCYSNCTI